MRPTFGSELGVVYSAEAKGLQAGMVDIPPYAQNDACNEHPQRRNEADKQYDRHDRESHGKLPENALVCMTPEDNRKQVRLRERGQKAQNHPLRMLRMRPKTGV
jgi:hypothetical protein